MSERAHSRHGRVSGVDHPRGESHAHYPHMPRRERAREVAEGAWMLWLRLTLQESAAQYTPNGYNRAFYSSRTRFRQWSAHFTRCAGSPTAATIVEKSFWTAEQRV